MITRNELLGSIHSLEKRVDLIDDVVQDQLESKS